MARDWNAEIAKNEKALKKEPDNANNHYNYGWALIQSRAQEIYQGKLSADTRVLSEKAEGSLKKAIELAPNHGRAHLLLGQLCRYTGRDKEAVEYARYAMGLPKDTNDWFAAAETVASSYMGLEKANEALEVLEEIREHYPDNAMILFKLVACYDFTKRYKEAEEACQHLLKVEPNHPQGKQMLPQIQEKLRKVEAMMAGPAKRDKAGGKDAPAQTSAPDPAVMQAKAAALSQKLQKQVAEIMNSGLSSDEKNKRMTKVQKDFNDELAALMKQN